MFAENPAVVLPKAGGQHAWVTVAHQAHRETVCTREECECESERRVTAK